MKVNQMELGLTAEKIRRSHARRQQRKQRAQWWFNQMRRVVDTAMEWKPEGSEQPEQVYLALTRKRSS